MMSRLQMRLNIPYGYGKKIADKAGVSARYVSKFLHDSSINSEKVQLAVLEIIAEAKEAKETKKRQLQQKTLNSNRR